VLFGECGVMVVEAVDSHLSWVQSCGRVWWPSRCLGNRCLPFLCLVSSLIAISDSCSILHLAEYWSHHVCHYVWTLLSRVDVMPCNSASPKRSKQNPRCRLVLLRVAVLRLGAAPTHEKQNLSPMEYHIRHQLIRHLAPRGSRRLLAMCTWRTWRTA